jgi:NADP-dependent 3-hydroxy acid dehydrogenase YdfG
VLKHFNERQSGQFVVTSSVAAKFGAPFSATYTATKHALHVRIKALQIDLIFKLKIFP